LLAFVGAFDDDQLEPLPTFHYLDSFASICPRTAAVMCNRGDAPMCPLHPSGNARKLSSEKRVHAITLSCASSALERESGDDTCSTQRNQE
jgi:hypothetical protein